MRSQKAHNSLCDLWMLLVRRCLTSTPKWTPKKEGYSSTRRGRFEVRVSFRAVFLAVTVHGSPAIFCGKRDVKPVALLLDFVVSAAFKREHQKGPEY